MFHLTQKLFGRIWKLTARVLKIKLIVPPIEIWKEHTNSSL